MIPVEDIPTAIRALKIYPDEELLKTQYIPEMVGQDDSQGLVSYATFEEKILKLMKANEGEPDTAEVVMEAFRAIDKDNTGIVTGKNIFYASVKDFQTLIVFYFMEIS